MTWDNDAIHRLLAALVPTDEHLAAYDTDPEFHTLIHGLARSLPAVIDWSLAQVPDRNARVAEATERLRREGFSF